MIYWIVDFISTNVRVLTLSDEDCCVFSWAIVSSEHKLTQPEFEPTSPSLYYMLLTIKSLANQNERIQKLFKKA